MQQQTKSNDPLTAAHDQAHEMGLRPGPIKTRGFTCDCPVCDGRGKASIGAGDTVPLIAHCFHADCKAQAKGGGVLILDKLKLNGGRAPSRRERLKSRIAAVKELREQRAHLEAVAASLRPVTDDDFPPELLWRSERMPGVLAGADGWIFFVIRDDAEGEGTIIGLERYAPPGSVARADVQLASAAKLQALAGSQRGLGPIRPRSLPPAEILHDYLFLCEGAPCAATLLGVGAAAVGFANCVGLREHEVKRIAARADGRHVVVFPDCDPAGRAGAAQTARSLRARGVDAVVLDLAPGVVDKTDIADHLRRRGPDAAAWLHDLINQRRTK